MHKFFREFYEALFVLVFSAIAAMLIVASEHELIQLMILVLVIILTETGMIARMMNFFGGMIYKKDSPKETTSGRK